MRRRGFRRKGREGFERENPISSSLMFFDQTFPKSLRLSLHSKLSCDIMINYVTINYQLSFEAWDNEKTTS